LAGQRDEIHFLRIRIDLISPADFCQKIVKKDKTNFWKISEKLKEKNSVKFSREFYHKMMGVNINAGNGHLPSFYKQRNTKKLKKLLGIEK